MDTPRKFDIQLAFLVVWTEQCVFNTHRPIANQIRIQIVPSVDRPLFVAHSEFIYHINNQMKITI